MKSQAPYPRIRYEKQKRKMESEVGAGHQTTRSYRRGGDQVLQGTTHLQHSGAAVPQLRLRGVSGGTCLLSHIGWTRKGRGVSRKGCAKVRNSNFPETD